MLLVLFTGAAAKNSSASAFQFMIDLNIQTWPKHNETPPDMLAQLAALEKLSIRNREEKIIELWSLGYYPKYLQDLQAVTVSNSAHRLILFISPDYLSLGSDDDPVLIPLSFINAARLARLYSFLLPTPKMVDIIYQNAALKIWPRSFPPDAQMNSVARFLEHNRWIQGQRGLTLMPIQLTAGHKKDVVLTNRLKVNNKRLALYGWQDMAIGSPIQPLSIWHHAEYVDYSHGIRLIGSYGLLDGRIVAIEQVLQDPLYAEILSSEGVIQLQSLLHPIPSKDW